MKHRLRTTMNAFTQASMDVRVMMGGVEVSDGG